MQPPRLLMVFFFVLGPQFPSLTVSQPGYNPDQIKYPGYPRHIGPDGYSNPIIDWAGSVATHVPAPVSTTPTPDQTDPCPAVIPHLFTANQRNCFHFSADQASWTDARNKCQELGQKYGKSFDLAELGNPSNLVSDNWLMETIARKGHRSWLGGYSPSEDNHWTWAYTGRSLPLIFPSWGPNEPNGDGWCVDAHNFGHRYYLNDLNCTQQHNYVCQQF